MSTVCEDSSETIITLRTVAIGVSNRLDPDQTPSYSASDPGSMCLTFLMIIVLLLRKVYGYIKYVTDEMLTKLTFFKSLVAVQIDRSLKD